MRHPVPRQTLLVILGVALAAGLSGCGDEPQPTAATPAPAVPTPAGQQGDRQRAVDNSQAADAVGYDGGALKASVQRTINTLDKHTADSQQATDAAGQNAPAAAP